jgi:hypothetical protein
MSSERNVHSRAQVCWLPKRGNTPAEYEDAYTLVDGQSVDGVFRCAVADGATEASYSRQWARALVRAFGAGTLGAANFVDDVERLRATWQRAFERHSRRRPMPWYAEQKASLGAFAALVGLDLRDDPATGKPGWSAVAVGDCNLFLMRGGELSMAFPLTRADQFGGGPFLIGSNRPAEEDPLPRRVQHASGELAPGDTFHLMSDALAAWFLRGHERGERPWQRREALPAGDATPAAFAELVTELRDAAQLHNDDVTWLRVVVSDVTVPAAAATDADGTASDSWPDADETTPF